MQDRNFEAVLYAHVECQLGSVVVEANLLQPHVWGWRCLEEELVVVGDEVPDDCSNNVLEDLQSLLGVLHDGPAAVGVMHELAVAA